MFDVRDRLAIPNSARCRAHGVRADGATGPEGNEYETRDYWTSEEAFFAFRERNLAEYEEIDRGFEELTEGEERVSG